MEENEKKDVEEVSNENKQEEPKTEEVKSTEETKAPEESAKQEETETLEESEKEEKPKETEKVGFTKPVEEPKQKSKKKKGVIITIVVLLIAAIAAVGAFFFLKKTSIDLKECLTVKYEGYSGYATATVEVNEKAVKDKIKDSSVAKSFIKKLEIETENTNKLSNGDEITVKVKIPSSFLEDNKLEVKEKTVKLKVEGLEEASSVDMSKYIDLKYKGYNKHATVEATLNNEKLEKDFGYETASKLKYRITLEVQDNGTLENGKNVKIKIKAGDISSLEEMGIKLNSDIVEMKVEGLSDATEVDAFKDIVVNISGMSPNLSVTITNNSTDEFLKTVQYSTSKKSGIANGETITITATRWDEDLANEKKLTLKETTKEYTVNGQAAYIFSLSEINDTVKAELKSIFISKATSKVNEEYDSWGYDNAKTYVRENTDYKYVDVEDVDRDLSIGTPEIVSMYLLTKKSDRNVDEINIITAIVKVPFKSAKAGVSYDWYITVQASNASLKADGKISENTNYSMKASYGEDEEKAYQEYVNKKKDNYNVEKISL